jgi:hypothetical protein
MREFTAEDEGAPRLRAWLCPEDPEDNIFDPFIERAGGWRIVIERPDAEGEDAIVRSTWEQHLHEALAHMKLYWPGTPVWRDFATGKVVNLDR